MANYLHKKLFLTTYPLASVHPLWTNKRRPSSAAFCQLKDMFRQTDLQQLWR